MEGVTFEIGTRGSFANAGDHSFTWDLVGYYTDLSDEILSIDNPNPFASSASLAVNVDSTIHAGIEFGGTHRLRIDDANEINTLLSYTYNYFRFDDDENHGNNELPAVPEHVLRFEIIYRHMSGIFFGPTFDIVSSRYADFENTYEIDGYSLVGLRGGYEQDSWSTYVEVRNLFDEDYIAGHSIHGEVESDDEVLGPGDAISVFAGAKVTF